MDFDRLLILARPGFESDAAAEGVTRLQLAGGWGHARTRDGSGLLELFPGGDDAWSWLAGDALAGMVFPRQICATCDAVDDLPPDDRLGPLLADWHWPVADAVVETAEGPGHRELGKLAGRLAGPLRGLLTARGLWRPERDDVPRLHLVLDSGTRAWLGASPLARSSPHAGGIPRMRRHRGAPSRSALKLEEGLLRFVGAGDRYLELKPGMTAADLGAAPGGWTWVLRRWGLSVFAVDNGALAPELAADPDVAHIRADAFTWEPPRPVDWLVCDLVDKPARVVELMARWLRRGWAKQALFNLKLPMRRRWPAVEDAQQRFFRILGPQAARFSLQIRHLYHDREEVTAYAAPRSPDGGV